MLRTLFAALRWPWQVAALVQAAMISKDMAFVGLPHRHIVHMKGPAAMQSGPWWYLVEILGLRCQATSREGSSVRSC